MVILSPELKDLLLLFIIIIMINWTIYIAP